MGFIISNYSFLRGYEKDGMTEVVVVQPIVLLWRHDRVLLQAYIESKLDKIGSKTEREGRFLFGKF